MVKVLPSGQPPGPSASSGQRAPPGSARGLLHKPSACTGHWVPGTLLQCWQRAASAPSWRDRRRGCYPHPRPRVMLQTSQLGERQQRPERRQREGEIPASPASTPRLLPELGIDRTLSVTLAGQGSWDPQSPGSGPPQEPSSPCASEGQRRRCPAGGHGQGHSRECPADLQSQEHWARPGGSGTLGQGQASQAALWVSTGPRSSMVFGARTSAPGPWATGSIQGERGGVHALTCAFSCVQELCPRWSSPWPHRKPGLSTS